MVQNRLIGASILLAMFAALAAVPQSEPRGTEMRSLLDDLTPLPSLKDLAAATRDFRGCDGGSNHVADFWTADVAGLYEPPANDVHGCHVNDFWTANVVGLYTLTSAAVSADDRDWCNVVNALPRGRMPDLDETIRLIELSVASADTEDP